ncbi:hypothetical protein D7V97_40490 [Corallococcus sp. CA053C]|nr:hypothetical protein D7V97_40490 [Corallococcus sp. CA053C]
MGTPSPLSLPPHLTQANTSKSNVLLSNSAQSTRGVLSFFGSFLLAASRATHSPSSPAGGVVASRCAASLNRARRSTGEFEVVLPGAIRAGQGENDRRRSLLEW